MEADIKQQKVHNQDTIQALLLVYNRPSLKKKSGGVSFNFWLCASISCLFLFLFVFCFFTSFLNTHNWGLIFFISATIDKYFAYRIIKSRTLSLLKLSSIPNKIVFSFNLKLWTLLQWSHINPSNLFQNSFTCWHLHIQCWILSLSRIQKLHKTFCAMPISFNTMLVAKILCNNLIWNHLSFR